MAGWLPGNGISILEEMGCVPFMQEVGTEGHFQSALTHDLSLPPASGVPQLVEPVLWDYGADLDVHSKGQYHIARGDPVTLTAQLGDARAFVSWLITI